MLEFRDALKRYRLAMLLALLGVIPAVGPVLSLISVYLMFTALSQMQHECSLLRDAYRYIKFLLIGTAIVLVATLAAAAVPALLSVTMIGGIAVAIISFLTEYFFYFGLEEMNRVHAFGYPAKRICWGFWVGLIVFALTVVLNDKAQSAASFAASLVKLYLVHTYITQVETQL